MREIPEPEEADLYEAVRGAKDAPIINVVNKILTKALQEQASDIHVEPGSENLRIRFRKDGILSEAIAPLPRNIATAVVARLKVIAALDIAERRMPQDGRMSRVFQGRKVDFRVSTLPNRYGEKVVLRILDNSTMKLGLDKIILQPDILQIVQQMLLRPYGLMLVTGPTGSGKTTTLYSALLELNNAETNINTIEDPIEYTMTGITQVQVLNQKGLDFSRVLRALLRQDPDVILVGEMRDPETVKTAVEAALTGHLVLSTLHTNDAPSALARLTEMGVEPFLVSDSLIGVVAQRLLRQVCSACRTADTPSNEECVRFSIPTNTSIFRAAYRVNNKSKPCLKCGGVGYNGRCGVYEVMRVTVELQKLISDRTPSEQLRKAAVASGMRTMLDYGVELVRQGITTLEEVQRVLYLPTQE